MSQFGKPIQLVVDNAKRIHVTRLSTNLGSNRGWKNSRASMWSRDSH
jgi:hypothetical protein